MTLELVLFETSDIHSHVYAYDYYNDRSTDHYGFTKIATALRGLRKQYPHHFLIDNGDLIQGSALSHFVVKCDSANNDVLPVFKVMNALEYDVANVGNHDFNYGVDFILKATQAAKFPYTCANVFHHSPEYPLQKGTTIFPSHIILNKTFPTGDNVKVGFIGLVPPQIMVWDKALLLDMVQTGDMVDAAKKEVEKIRANVDIVVILAHSGMLPPVYKKNAENAVHEITKIPGVDAVLSGHVHATFPGGKNFNHLEGYGIDNQKGTVNGIPVVIPGAWGSHIGVIKLSLTKQIDVHQKASYAVTQHESFLVDMNPYQEDEEIKKIAAKEHEATLKYIREYVGETDNHFTSWFSLLESSLALQFVHEIILKYAKTVLQNTELADLPLLSACAQVNTGSHGTPYVDIRPGPLSIKDISNLYPYDNEIKFVKLSGSDLKNWLEFSAKIFHHINPTEYGDINIVNPSIPSFNFDCIFGVSYKIDITKPTGSRIVDLKYLGEPVSHLQTFLLVTNNYRAYGGGYFPNMDGSQIVYDMNDLYRDVLIDYVRKVKTINIKYERHWELIPFKTQEQQVVYYETSLDSLPFKPNFLHEISKNIATNRVRYQIKF